MTYFNYCSSALGYIGKGLSDKLQKLQNRAARVVTFSGYEDCWSDLLDELGSEELEIKRLKLLAVVMYEVYNNLSPLYLK